MFGRIKTVARARILIDDDFRLNEILYHVFLIKKSFEKKLTKVIIDLSCVNILF